jgi:hypothetical protein
MLFKLPDMFCDDAGNHVHGLQVHIRIGEIVVTHNLPFIGTRPERLYQAAATTNLCKHLNRDAATAIKILFNEYGINTVNFL